MSLVFTNLAQANNAQFTKCISNLQSEARNQGISTKTAYQVLGNAKHIQRVIDLDRRQPEFTQSFAEYFDLRISPERIKRGQVLLAEHQQLLDQIQNETGVPAQFLVAFWGLETNYGGYLGNTSILNSLATLACDERRRAFFTGELLNALRIIDSGDISVDRMIGSWAGAMGHMQFMPSTYLAYAQDGDGDGRRDLWQSIPDAIKSAGNFLQKLGWNPDIHWGQEVQLPSSFDYSLAGRNHALSITEWVSKGVTAIAGKPLLPSAQKASLLVPAGHQGPAFLVTKNFDVIMRWNRSEFYALSVGHLADRIAGAPPLLRSASAADGIKLTREQVRRLQLDLTALGIDVGEADGVLGPITRKALSRFQQNTQRIADGHINKELLVAIREAAASQTAGNAIID